MPKKDCLKPECTIESELVADELGDDRPQNHGCSHGEGIDRDGAEELLALDEDGDQGGPNRLTDCGRRASKECCGQDPAHRRPARANDQGGADHDRSRRALGHDENCASVVAVCPYAGVKREKDGGNAQGEHHESLVALGPVQAIEDEPAEYETLGVANDGIRDRVRPEAPKVGLAERSAWFGNGRRG